MDSKELNSYIKAGEIAQAVKRYAREIIKPGVPLIEIARKVDDKIIELGGELGFPVNLSIDEVAAHFTPDSTSKEVATGLLKFDVGITVNGFFADTAISFDLTEDNRHKDLVEINKEMQEAVIRTVKPGIKVSNIGDAVMDVLDEANEKHDNKFALIDGLSGHMVGKDMIHAGLTIPNYRNDSENKLDEMAFAVEPFLTTGNGKIYSGEGGGIYSINSEAPARDKEARKVVEYIKENFKTRPFCMRWLEREGFTKLKFIFASLKKQGIFYEYPKLIEKTKKPVAQCENLFVISDGKAYCTTRE
ncbi:type II methionyl aminopeptidase [archaeon]|jgi:methionyl aminopeptidase|nr:type II methionyl aminopeptidase [archaeon]MBT6182951.1 type II methionyl aminopeptidase [archaeon]MBT6606584.1 type II methionyl aminopeptidase [archaeon]MBT7251789.1 type II methionyl aminopeptidase [archaeon]MBT7660810.1 type II methionyl aminopeptidase [archaeon]